MEKKVLAFFMVGLTMLAISGVANAVIVPLISHPAENDPHSVAGYTVYNWSEESDSWNEYGYTGGDYTGIYLGTISKNDDEDKLESLIAYFFGESADILYDKTETSSDATSKFGAFTVDNVDDISGSWSVNDASNSINFYAIKATSNFALYYVNSPLTTGIWTTRHTRRGVGQDPRFSHMAVSVVSGEPVPEPVGEPVPEPGALLLFGTGLLGIAGAVRRRFKNRM